MTRRITLVGDGIENPWNAAALLDAAALFDSACLFRDRAGLQAGWRDTFPGSADLRYITAEQIDGAHAPLIAVDNLPGAVEVYGFRLPYGERPAAIVGNERRGIAHDLRGMASHAVMIPMQSRSLNCLNVATAAAIALYTLGRGGGAPMPNTQRPEQRRPELLLLGPADHIECGSTIRSAGAFGWQRLFIEDRSDIWFGVDRITRSEGWAAARRARNPIRVIPSPRDRRYAFDEVCVLTPDRGVPLERAKLTRGNRQLLILPDTAAITHASEDWERFGKHIGFAHLDLPRAIESARFRLVAGIALSEAARQIGRRHPTAPAQPRRRDPFYDRALGLLGASMGEMVDLADLDAY